MKRYLPETLRWATIVGCLAFAAWMLVLLRPWRCSLDDGFSATMSLLMLGFDALLVLPPLAVAYFCFRRQYRKIYYVVGVVGAVVVFGGLVSVPLPSDLKKMRPQDMNAGQNFMMLAWLFFELFVPAYAAAGFYRLCRWLANRKQQPVDQPRLKTRATWWLVWLGAAWAGLPGPILMLVHLNRMMAGPQAKPPADVGNDMSPIAGLAMFGTVLMFLGFVTRKPVKPLVVEAEPSASRLASTNPGDGVAE